MDRLYRLAMRLAALLLVLVPVTAPAEPPAVHPALWKVADKDTTIYLFGTVHVLPPGIPWYNGKLAAAFEGSQELVTEIVDTDPTKATMMKWATLSGDQTLRGLLSPEDKAGYEGALKTLGMPVQAFDGYEPWLAAMILSVAPLSEAGFRPENGVDEALGAKAKARGLPHGALETYEYQMSLFDSLPLETQKLYLAQVVKDLPSVRGQIEQMTEAWKKGDAEALAKLVNEQEDYPGMYEMLLTNRNKTWANWVQARMKQPGTVFVAVGAGHLAGPGSLQEQLAAKGIKAERVQ